MQLQKKMTAPKAFPRVAMDLATTVERIQQVGVPCKSSARAHPHGLRFSSNPAERVLFSNVRRTS